MRKIELHDMMFHAYHGVGIEEQTEGGEYLVSVIMDVDFAVAEESDSLSDTVDYEKVYGVIKSEMEKPSKLLEHVAGRTGRELRMAFREIQALELRITKLNPPIEGMTGSASVIIKI